MNLFERLFGKKKEKQLYKRGSAPKTFKSEFSQLLEAERVRRAERSTTEDIIVAGILIDALTSDSNSLVNVEDSTSKGFSDGFGGGDYSGGGAGSTWDNDSSSDNSSNSSSDYSSNDSSSDW